MAKMYVINQPNQAWVTVVDLRLKSLFKLVNDKRQIMVKGNGKNIRPALDGDVFILVRDGADFNPHRAILALSTVAAGSGVIPVPQNVTGKIMLSYELAHVHFYALDCYEGPVEFSLPEQGFYPARWYRFEAAIFTSESEKERGRRLATINPNPEIVFLDNFPK